MNPNLGPNQQPNTPKEDKEKVLERGVAHLRHFREAMESGIPFDPEEDYINLANEEFRKAAEKQKRHERRNPTPSLYVPDEKMSEQKVEVLGEGEEDPLLARLEKIEEKVEHDPSLRAKIERSNRRAGDRD